MNPDGEGPRTGLRLGWAALAVMTAVLVVSGVLLLGRHTVPGTPAAHDVGRPPATTPDDAACGNRPASVSGIDNTIVLTGHCARVDVSGIRNVVSVEEADAIVVSGMDNNVTYQSGDPELSESGLRNTLARG